MKSIRKQIGGLGNLMFKEAYLWSQMRKGLIPDVYLQGESYWQDYKGEIKTIFGAGIGSDDRVSLHIRLGDYLSSTFYVNLMDTNYYQEAVKHFPDDRFLVFCADRQGRDDKDRETAREFLDTFIKDRYVIRRSESETEDLNAMASCKSNIGANSSFSWWASYLNPHLDKTVIMPSKWFTDGVERIELLKEWMVI